jgi:hypothetical protein
MRAGDLIRVLQSLPSETHVNFWTDKPDEHGIGCVTYIKMRRVALLLTDDSEVTQAEQILWNDRQGAEVG